MTNIRVTYFWMSPFSLLPPVPFAFSYVPRPSPPVCSRWIHRVRVSCTQIEPLTRSVSDLTVSVNIKRSESERARKRESTRAPYLATCRTWGCAPVLLGRAREQELQTIKNRRPVCDRSRSTDKLYTESNGAGVTSSSLSWLSFAVDSRTTRVSSSPRHSPPPEAIS